MDSGEVTQWLDGIVSNVGTPITLLELLKKTIIKISAAEAEISPFLFHTFFFLFKT